MESNADDDDDDDDDESSRSNRVYHTGNKNLWMDFVTTHFLLLLVLLCVCARVCLCLSFSLSLLVYSFLLSGWSIETVLDARIE